MTSEESCLHEHAFFFRANRNTGHGVFAYRLYQCEDCKKTWWKEVQ